MKNFKYSVEMQVYGNPIDLKDHSKNEILGVFNSKDEAESFILEKKSPDQYSEDLEGWVVKDRFSFFSHFSQLSFIFAMIFWHSHMKEIFQIRNK